MVHPQAAEQNHPETCFVSKPSDYDLSDRSLIGFFVMFIKLDIRSKP
jgi:hypothetical protein